MCILTLLYIQYMLKKESKYAHILKNGTIKSSTLAVPDLQSPDVLGLQYIIVMFTVLLANVVAIALLVVKCSQIGSI